MFKWINFTRSRGQGAKGPRGRGREKKPSMPSARSMNDCTVSSRLSISCRAWFNCRYHQMERITEPKQHPYSNVFLRLLIIDDGIFPSSFRSLFLNWCTLSRLNYSNFLRFFLFQFLTLNWKKQSDWNIRWSVRGEYPRNSMLGRDKRFDLLKKNYLNFSCRIVQVFYQIIGERERERCQARQKPISGYLILLANDHQYSKKTSSYASIH